MSIPNTEFKPDRFRTPPQTQIRRYLGEASDEEKQHYLDLLRQRATSKPLHFVLQLALSVLFFVLGLGFNLTLLTFVAVLITPSFSPVLSMALSPALSSLKKAGVSFLIVIVMTLALFGAGYLSTLLNPSTDVFQAMPLAFVLNNGWIEYAVLVIVAILTALMFSRHNPMAQLGAVVFNLFIFIPFLLAGCQLGQLNFAGILPLLTLTFHRLFLVLTLMVIVFWILKVKPKAFAGYLLLILFAGLFVLSLYETLNKTLSLTVPDEVYYKMVEVMPAAENQPETNAVLTDQKGRIKSSEGTGCRLSPMSDIASHMLEENKIVQLYGDEYDFMDNIYYKVRSESGEDCWVNSADIELLEP